MAKIEKDKSMVKSILNIFLWIVLFVWIGITIFDFVQVKGKKDPVFCVSTSEKEYIDGKTTSCIGLGYKVIKYDRESIKAIEFKPIWAQPEYDE